MGHAGQVHAFEPTGFASAKLRANLALNPSIRDVVSVHQCFLVSHPAEVPLPAVAASWPVAGQSRDLNAWQGHSESTAGATATTADAFFAAAGLTRLDLVKLDVDGHEWAVLQGFRATLARHRPVIIVEFAPFIYAGEKSREFDACVAFLAGLNYRFTDANTGRPLPHTAGHLRRVVPAGGGVNALLYPR